jgi:hypothetical protein
VPSPFAKVLNLADGERSGFYAVPVTSAARTLRRFFENVVGYLGIGSGDPVQNPIERDLRLFGIVVLAGFDLVSGNERL